MCTSAHACVRVCLCVLCNMGLSRGPLPPAFDDGRLTPTPARSPFLLPVVGRKAQASPSVLLSPLLSQLLAEPRLWFPSIHPGRCGAQTDKSTQGSPGSLLRPSLPFSKSEELGLGAGSTQVVLQGKEQAHCLGGLSCFGLRRRCLVRGSGRETSQRS